MSFSPFLKLTKPKIKIRIKTQSYKNAIVDYLDINNKISGIERK